MSQTVADVLVDVLERIGVKHIFGLIGDSLNPLADAVRRSNIEWIGVRHEEGAALAAAGQAKLTGQLAVCAGTTGPGSTHLVAGLYEASRDHAPVLALSGDMPRKMHGTDYHPGDRAGSPVSRRLALYGNRFFPGAGAGSHSSGDRRCLCRPWRRPPDAAARCHRGEGRRRRLQRRNLETEAGVRGERERTSRKSPAGSMRPAVSSSCAGPDAMAQRKSCARSRTGSRRR